MTFEIELSKEAGANLESLFKADRRLFNRILNKIESLSESPKEGKPLIGNHKGEFSLRVGNYRPNPNPVPLPTCNISPALIIGIKGSISPSNVILPTKPPIFILVSCL